MMTNALRPMRAVEALADLVSPNGVIRVMSSRLRSIVGNESGGWEVYQANRSRTPHEGETTVRRRPGTLQVRL